MFTKFLSRGLCVIPLKAGVPQVEWSKYAHNLPTADITDNWHAKEYALVCGKVSNIIALDIDTDETARIYGLAGHTTVRKKGSKGFTAFYRYNGEVSQNWKDTNGQVICEILSDKRLTTIPPSPHRKTGKPYVWVEDDLFNVTDIPALNDDFILLMSAKYPKRERFTVQAPKSLMEFDDLQLHEAEDMLSYITADCSRDTWIQIGMALRDEFGDAACHVWHNWSAKGKTYKHNDAQAAWRSFSSEGVTIATLVYYAKQNGWLPHQTHIEPSPSLTEPNLPPIIQEVAVTGLVGDIANWITSTAIRPQPELSLAAALSFVATMKGHRVQSAMKESRTNLLILSLAPTGGGKDHPQYAIQKLMRSVGLEKSIMGRPTSGTALLTGLKKADCVGWLGVDEFGRYLANASGKQAQVHQREIADYMIDLYTVANRKFYGRQYANDKENPQTILDQPHFCCLGSTVEEKMREACKSGEVIDGFLNRWLVFHTDQRPKKNLSTKNFEPPQDIIDKINVWLKEFPITHDNLGNITPYTIEFSQEAWKELVKFEERFEELVSLVPYPMNELYARGGEHVIKVSTTLADDKMVSVQDVTTAIHIVEKSISMIVKFAGGIADNQHEQNVIYVLDVIKKSGKKGISKNHLTRSTRRLQNKDRLNILEQLLESGEINHEKSAKKIVFFAQ